jgi:predicted GH43/DUF377 family glycosyl hydrolase
MIVVKRHPANPIFSSTKELLWEKEGAFNGCILKDTKGYVMVYRAFAEATRYANASINISSVGYAESEDGVHFGNRRQLIAPEHDWERFGCEDPRITKIDGTYYIFYTALSMYPFGAPGIKVAMAKTRSLDRIEERHPVTPFNAKAMAMFPEKIDGKFAAILTAHTDMPPSKISIAVFDHEEDIWSKDWWDAWYKDLDSHVVPLQRKKEDHIEVGAPPVKTDKGWVLVYCYIHNYNGGGNRIFGIEAALLDLKDPRKIIGRTPEPLLVPEKSYELNGIVPGVIFPTGAVDEGDSINIYYGAADTTTAIATVSKSGLLSVMTEPELPPASERIRLQRYDGNPILLPIEGNKWESKLTFNPTAVYEDGRVHILYRAMGADDTSTVGYASSRDGFHLDERLDFPVYTPREPFEAKYHPGNSGAEDPRITRIGDTYYVCYCAYDGNNPPRCALTTIKVEDFLAKRWNFTKSILISPPGMDDKDHCVFPEKVNGKFAVIHRFNPHMWIDYSDTLEFGGDKWVRGEILMSPSVFGWDNEKIGLGSTPIKTEKGWVVIYHGISKDDLMYRLGAILLDPNNPSLVIGKLPYPILEPEMPYETNGARPGTVFACGNVVIDGQLIIYYGAGDSVSGVASTPFEPLVDALVASGK